MTKREQETATERTARFVLWCAAVAAIVVCGIVALRHVLPVRPTVTLSACAMPFAEGDGAPALLSAQARPPFEPDWRPGTSSGAPGLPAAPPSAPRPEGAAPWPLYRAVKMP